MKFLSNTLSALFWWTISTLHGDSNPLAENRSPLWRKCRNNHLKKHPKCELCGGTDVLRVHHIQPFHIAPDLELEPDNLITLCERKKYGINCHFWYGHLGNWRLVNETCVEDVAKWHDKRIDAYNRQKK